MKLTDKRILEDYRAKLERIKASGDIDVFETKETQTARINRAKKDIAYFVKTYLRHYISDAGGKIIETPDFHIAFAAKVKKNKRIKAIMRWARAHAKSVLADLILPLWLWINDDIGYLVLIGNNEEKAKILLSDLQAEFEANEQLKHDFGTQMRYGTWEKGYFITKNGFIAKAVGAGQDVRGLRMKAKRPDYIVADDLEDKDTVRSPKKQDELADWILSAVIPTMDGDRARFLLANNRFAPRMIQTVLEELTDTWTIDQVNAYNPASYESRWAAKYTPDYWRQIEREIGVIKANAEYNNTPHVQGKIFKQEQIQWGQAPHKNQFRKIVGHWDVAYAGNSTSDYNAVRVWGLYNSDFWYLDSFVKQTKMREAVQWMCDYQKRLPQTVTIQWRFEAQFWNDEVQRVINEVQNEFKLNLNIVKTEAPRGRKYDRIERLQPYFQNSRIVWDKDKKAHADTQIGLQQLFGIEPGYRSHDDAPDADEQAIRYLENYLRVSNFNIRSGKFRKPQNRNL